MRNDLTLGPKHFSLGLDNCIQLTAGFSCCCKNLSSFPCSEMKLQEINYTSNSCERINSKLRTRDVVKCVRPLWEHRARLPVFWIRRPKVAVSQLCRCSRYWRSPFLFVLYWRKRLKLASNQSAGQVYIPILGESSSYFTRPLLGIWKRLRTVFGSGEKQVGFMTWKRRWKLEGTKQPRTTYPRKEIATRPLPVGRTWCQPDRVKNSTISLPK